MLAMTMNSLYYAAEHGLFKSYSWLEKFSISHLRNWFGNVSLARELGYYMAWSTIVRQYTSCNLTNPSDKLVAISGLARRMHAGIGGTVNYIAGLWDRYLFLQLLWSLQNGSGPVLELVMGVG
jgi:hypothetical protein